MYKPSKIVLKITDYPRYLLGHVLFLHNVFVFKAFSYFMHLHQKTIMH